MAGPATTTVRAAVQRSWEAVGLTPGSRLGLAVSGGQDSVCLLDALGSFLTERGEQPLVLHVDHGLRGTASAADASFVERLASERGYRAVVVRVDVPGYAIEHRLGTEEAARACRYWALAAAIGPQGRVATGHTIDDSAESLLINIVRGTGPTGTTSIHPTHKLEPSRLGPPPRELAFSASALGEIVVLRPLLEVSREATAAYCRELGLAYRSDTSNLDPSHLRNRIRHHLLPLLRTYNPSIVSGLARLAALAGDDELELERLAARAWAETARLGPGEVSFSWSGWLAASPAIQRRLLRRAARELGLAAWSFDAVESARLLLAGRPVGRRLSLAGRVRLATSRAGFRLALPREPGADPELSAP